MQPATVTPLPATTMQGSLASAGSRPALAGFFVAGLVLAFPGAILPAWQHHISSDYLTVGLYFVALIAGLVASVRSGSLIIARKGLSWSLSCACASAAVGLLGLALASPPVAAGWRLLGIAVLGWAAGLLHRAIFQAITPMYRHDPASTVNLAGILFGLGCFAVAFFVSRTYYTYTPEAIQILLALVPAFFAIWYAGRPFAGGNEETQSAPHLLLKELKTPGAVLLSLVLFFQLGNEWAMAGWLPLFLSQRLGMSPQAAIMILAIYWLALLIGRVAAQWILPNMRHSRLLGLCLLISMFACCILLFTDNQFGAVSGVVLLGLSFAPMYPLVVERIGRRFPDYRPGFYNGIFSIALAGGMLAPSTLGYFAWLLDVRAVMALPLAGSVVVFVLLAGLWIEERLVPSGLGGVMAVAGQASFGKSSEEVTAAVPERLKSKEPSLPLTEVAEGTRPNGKHLKRKHAKGRHGAAAKNGPLAAKHE